MTTPSEESVDVASFDHVVSVAEMTKIANEFYQLAVGESTSGGAEDAQSAVSPAAVGGVITTPSAAGTPVPSIGTDPFLVDDEALDRLARTVEFDSTSELPADVADYVGLVDAVPTSAEQFDVQSSEISAADTQAVDVQVDDPDLVGAQAEYAGVVPTTDADLTAIAQELVSELPDGELIHKSIAGHPQDFSGGVDYVLGDHPFLESKYDAANAEGGLDVFPVGAEFTGQNDLVDEIPGLAEAIATADDTLRGAEASQTEFAEPTELVLTETSEKLDSSADHDDEVGGGSESLAGSFSPELVPTVPVKRDQFDIEQIKADFPILRERVNGHQLVWLDNGATTQKPQCVIDRLSYYYEHENSNVHRTAHTLAGRSTDAYEGAREKIRKFINAKTADEIVYVRGTTEGINLIANTFGEQNVCEGDEILISNLEHHANTVPWQMLCNRKGATLKVVPVDDTGQIILSEFERLISPRTKLISFTQVSNALGTITPAAEMIEIAHRHGVPVVLDGAQGVLHMTVDVQTLDPDFYVFSGHKMFAPLGIGVVYGKLELLEKMPPWQGGGNMIDTVYYDRTTFQPPPWRFEAGTGSIADAVGLGAAIDYITDVGMENIAAHEHELLLYGTEALNTIPGLRIIGTAANKAAVMSFVLEGHSPTEIGNYLDRQGIAVRAGHHCAQPILRRFGVSETVRPSLALYNTTSDIDRLVEALRRLRDGRDQ